MISYLFRTHTHLVYSLNAIGSKSVWKSHWRYSLAFVLLHLLSSTLTCIHLGSSALVRIHLQSYVFIHVLVFILNQICANKSEFVCIHPYLYAFIWMCVQLYAYIWIHLNFPLPFVLLHSSSISLFIWIIMDSSEFTFFHLHLSSTISVHLNSSRLISMPMHSSVLICIHLHILH